MRSLSGFAARLAGWALLAAVTAIPALAEERSVVGLGYAPHIVWDGIAGKLRLWQHDGFEAELKFEQRDSTDGGNTWSAPTVIRNGPQRYGTSVIDEGVPGPQRFKNAFYQSRSGADGIYTEISPDGVNWSVTTQAPIFTPAEADDIADLWMNPLTGGYFVPQALGQRGSANLDQPCGA